LSHHLGLLHLGCQILLISKSLASCKLRNIEVLILGGKLALIGVGWLLASLLEVGKHALLGCLTVHDGVLLLEDCSGVKCS
jgi:hypothetical protein